MRLTKIKIISSCLTIFAVLALVCGIFVWNNKSKAYAKPTKTIPIAMALDDEYLYPTIVSITTMAENKNGNTFYDFYIMHPSEFTSDSKDKLNSLNAKYKNIKINLIDMGARYNNAGDKGSYMAKPTYYRLYLSDILPSFDKLLWLDSDVIVFEDLSSMYDVDVSGYYYKGFLDDTSEMVYKSTKNNFGISMDKYICSGVMVVNLAELRKDNMVKKFDDFVKENGDKLIQNDQTVINVVGRNKIDCLEPRYGIFNYIMDKNSIVRYSEFLKGEHGYTVNNLCEAARNPAVIHCVYKPWKTMKVPYAIAWWKYATRTDYYKEIEGKYRGLLEQN